MIFNMDYTNLHKCLFSTELFNKPPKFLDDLKEKLEEYVKIFIDDNMELVKELDIKNEISRYKYEKPSNILNPNKSLRIPVISINWRMSKSYMKKHNKVNLFAKDINLDFEYKNGKNTFKICQHPYYSNGNKRLLYIVKDARYIY